VSITIILQTTPLRAANGKKILHEVTGRIFKPASTLDHKGKIMSSSKTIECVYEGGVFRPLQEVDFREGERLKLTIKKFDISKFCGAFGEGSIEEFETLEEEAQM